MKNRLYSTGELHNISLNLELIEKQLGHPVPGGIIDPDELKDHLLTGGEMVKLVSNISAIERKMGRKSSSVYRNHQPSGELNPVASVLMLAVFAFAVFMALCSEIISCLD